MPLGYRVDIDTAGIAVSLDELQTRTATLAAVKAGIRIVSRVAKAMAPKRFGALRVAQGTKAKKGKKGKTPSFAVQGARTKYKRMRKGKVIRPAKYDHLVIGGVKPHSIRKGSSLGRKLKSGEVIPRTGQDVGKPHPGARANPYRIRAYRAVRSQVVSEMKKEMGKAIEKILKKANERTIKNLKKFAAKKIGLR